MGRFIALFYGLVGYAVFFLTTLYAIGFVSGVAHPSIASCAMKGPRCAATW